MYSDDDFIEFDSSEAEMEEPEEDQILNITSLKSAMQSTVSDVLEVLEINEGVARILLQKYRWNKDVLMDKFYESADRNSFLTEANVIPKTVPVLNTQEECEICCDTETQLDGLACGHQACVNCWKLYLAERIGDGQSEIECLDSSCNLLIEDEKVRHFLKNDQKLLERFDQLRNLVSIKMEQIQECTSKSWNDVRFLQKAIDILSTCRRTLMYTYIFAFYLQEGNNRELFESNQKDLEMTTETLTGFLENELEDQDVTTLMTDVQDKCRYLQQRRQILLEYCIEGLDNNTWVFTE
ncbi:hypothetical protein CAEBREN_31696 [Caenorhabditis brenneri]|uniref:E3 ubiquitin-protein ligase ARIH1-like UBA-like domain-containing protein n=1 Tax=Caenorhabditis brenneri TaxID=135651 RepID=G0MIX5_CAEBE|nr:hypothetical protein CAEBREN_31696 [Caenorhabditis brenneri]